MGETGKMMEFGSWDDDIPNIWKVIKFMFQTTNQTISFEEKKHLPGMPPNVRC